MHHGEEYTIDSLVEIKKNQYFRIGDVSVWVLLKTYRKQQSGKQKKDPLFIDYIESHLQGFYADAQKANNKSLVNSIESLSVFQRQALKVKHNPYRLLRLNQSERKCNKIPYSSRKSAKKALGLIRAQEQTHAKPIRSYLCDICGFWHHTSLPIEVWKQKKKNQ